MGNCINACENAMKKQRDVYVDSIENEKYKKLSLIQKISSQPFYSTLIYLQCQIKKHLKKKKKKIKNYDTTTNIISTTTQRKENSSHASTCGKRKTWPTAAISGSH